MKVLFANRPAARAWQFNSAQISAAVSITTWMLSLSREVEETELHYRHACELKQTKQNKTKKMINKQKQRLFYIND